MKHFEYSKLQKIKLLFYLLLLSLAFFLLLKQLVKETNPPKSLLINEVCSSNFSLYKDESNNYPDYIELYNASETPISLEGYYISDDKSDLLKVALGAITLQPKEYHAVWLTDTAGSNEIGFKINALGEELFLSNANKEIIDSINVPKLRYNTSFGRTADGGEIWSEMATTFGGSNNEAELFPSIKLNAPNFNVESGFYNEEFSLQIESSPTEKIYYTLDGSTPTLNSTLYDNPIAISEATQQENVLSARTDLSPTNSYLPDFNVDKATIVRAISYNETDNSISEIVTKVYFVGYEEKAEYSDLPIISVVADPSDLLDYDKGIYANGKAYDDYMQNGGMVDGVLQTAYEDANGQTHNLYEASNAFNKGRNWEREASITYFDNSHTLGFEQNVGIRIAGASTRGTPQKSISIYGRDIYDDTVYFQEELFPNVKLSTFKLRNGGSGNADVKIIDAFLESFIDDRNVSVQRSKPCIVFLNGEYWGIYNIRERYDEEYLWNYYHVNTNNVWMIKNGSAEIGDSAAQEAYEYLRTLVTECDLTYDDVYAMVAEQVDVQSLIDYCCVNLYTDNIDISFVQNMELWRTIEPTENAYGDCKWRWMVFDMDITLNDYSEADPSVWMQEYSLINEPFIQSFMKNEQFRKQFCITLMDLANINYSYEKVHPRLMDWQDIYQDQMVKNHRRFFDADFSAETYDTYIHSMDPFFENRFSFVMEGLDDTFNLSGTLEPVHVSCSDIEGGSVTINTSKTAIGADWTGYYYNDFPIVLTATAAEGYRFVGWSGDVISEDNQLELMIPTGGLSLQATFEKVE